MTSSCHFQLVRVGERGRGGSTFIDSGMPPLNGIVYRQTKLDKPADGAGTPYSDQLYVPRLCSCAIVCSCRSLLPPQHTTALNLGHGCAVEFEQLWVQLNAGTMTWKCSHKGDVIATAALGTCLQARKPVSASVSPEPHVHANEGICTTVLGRNSFETRISPFFSDVTPSPHDDRARNCLQVVAA